MRASLKAMSVPGEAIGEGEAHGVGSVALNDLDGINDVAFGLGHLLAVGVAHERVDVDFAEGYGIFEVAFAAVGHGHVRHEVAAEHDHAGDPEEEDVEAGDEELGGIERVEIARVARASRIR